MIGSIGGASASNPYLTRMMGRLDTDASGGISQDEFVAGRPKNATEGQASRMFASLDPAGDGSLSADDLASAFQQMSSRMRSTMLQAQEEAGADAGPGSGPGGPGGGRGPGGPGGAGGPGGPGCAGGPGGPGGAGGPGGPGGAGGAEFEDDTSEETSLFLALDTNGDGVVSQAEFQAGKPDNVSEEKVRALWEEVSDGSGDGLTEDQFVEAVKAARPAPPDVQAEATEASRIEDEQLRQLLTVIDTYRNATRATAERRTDATTSFSA